MQTLLIGGDYYKLTCIYNIGTEGYADRASTYNILGRNCAWLALERLQVSTTGDINQRIQNMLWIEGDGRGDRDYTSSTRNTIVPYEFKDIVKELFGQ